MLRDAMTDLLAWRDRPDRLPLLLRGARQVGKTWLLTEFGEKAFDTVVHANFDEHSGSRYRSSLAAIFDGDLRPQRIVQDLSTLYDTDIVPGRTLLILDEIQTQPRAITALKYFAEDMPGLHVVAAGSHLGVSLHAGVSYPVGKVTMLTLRPLNFAEFADAMGRSRLATALRRMNLDTLATFHGDLIGLLKTYLVTGGMPAAVNRYLATRDLRAVRETQRDLLTLFRLDFSKHAPAHQLARIWQVWDSIPVHLSHENQKVVWGAVRPGARARDFEEALQWLYDYGVAYRVDRINKPGMPLKAYVDEGVFKLFLLDVGLLGAQADLDPRAVVSGDDVFTEFRGTLTEQYVHQELLAGGSTALFYWAANRAEVDFVIQIGPEIVPIEVKAGEARRSRSLLSYIDRYAPARAVRTSLSPYRAEDTMTNVPLYAVGGLNTLWPSEPITGVAPSSS